MNAKMTTRFTCAITEAKANYILKTLNELYPSNKWVISYNIDKTVYFKSLSHSLVEPRSHNIEVCCHLYDDTVKVKGLHNITDRVQHVTWHNGTQELFRKIDFGDDNDVRNAMIDAVGIDGWVTA